LEGQAQSRREEVRGDARQDVRRRDRRRQLGMMAPGRAFLRRSNMMRAAWSLLVATACASADSEPTKAPPPAPAAPAPAPAAAAPAPAPAPGADFIGDAKLLYRIAACGGDDAVAPELDKIVARHCKLIREHLDKFRAVYFDKGRAWFD